MNHIRIFHLNLIAALMVAPVLPDSVAAIVGMVHSARMRIPTFAKMAAHASKYRQYKIYVI